MSSESKAKKFENLTNFANYSLKRPEEKTEENEKEYKKLIRDYSAEGQENRTDSRNYNENSKSSFQDSLEKYFEKSNSFIDLIGIYDPFLNSRKTFVNKTLTESDELHNDYLNELNFSLKCELSFYSKFSFNWLHSCLNIQTLQPQEDEDLKIKYFKKFNENLTCYKYEFSKNSKLFEEIEYDKNYEIIDSLMNAYKQFKDDKNKIFYLIANNFNAVFLHYCAPNKNFESFLFISAKNKSIIRLLEKEEIPFHILHKHEKIEGISTPQKLMRLENSRNNLFGMEVSPGIELLKLEKKNVHSFFNYFLNNSEHINPYFQLIAPYQFNNSSIISPKITFDGEVIMNQKKNDFMLEAENPSFKTQIESKEFYKTESECIITPLFSQESQENKLFKVSLKGFFFNFQIRKIKEILNEMGVNHKIEAKNLELSQYFKKENLESKQILNN